MKIIIIDDEDNCRIVLKNQIRKYCLNSAFIGEADSVESGIKIIKQLKPELVFLDIHMADGSGFDLLNKLENINFKLIFTTAFDHYAIKAFKYSAIDYLLKPIDHMELSEAYTRAQNVTHNSFETAILLENYNNGLLDKLTLKTENGIYILVIHDIEYIEADSSYCIFNLVSKETIHISKPLKEYAQILPKEQFYRTHKSFLVNINNIRSLKKGTNYIEMNSGKIVSLSRRNKQEFIELYAKSKNS